MSKSENGVVFLSPMGGDFDHGKIMRPVLSHVPSCAQAGQDLGPEAGAGACGHRRLQGAMGWGSGSARIPLLGTSGIMEAPDVGPSGCLEWVKESAEMRGTFHVTGSGAHKK